MEIILKIFEPFWILFAQNFKNPDKRLNPF